ncbi:MAG: patatin-like phospholipase family protein [Desulfococcaceae bacterium]
MKNHSNPASLVLGSGGARGLAHIGVIRALEEHGRCNIRSIAGSSMGSLVGGLYAGGKLDTYTEWVRGLSAVDMWRLLDFSFTGQGLFEGKRLMKKLCDLVGEIQIEDLAISFAATASDIERREVISIDRGSLFDAIRASIAIPGFFTPVPRNGRLLVDGGLLSPVPLELVHREDAERIIVVSLNGNGDPDDPDPSKAEESEESETPEDRSAEGQNSFQRWYREARAKLGLDSDENEGPSAVDILTKSLEAMQDRIARFQMEAAKPDLLIEISVNACGFLDFHLADEMIELGYRTALRAIRRAENFH